MTKFQKRLVTGLVVMALLTPLGIVLPMIAGSEDAWGEWGSETLQKLLGYLPEGFKKIADLWKAPLPDYNMGGDGAGIGTQVVSYIVSGLLGIILVVLVIFVIMKFVVKK
ncbi:MAG: PDGLE domain-containing protein [Nitrospiraceae bacterium]|nr:PDGLE domain-containing protein [Nitrospiraceae bacterium]